MATAHINELTGKTGRIYIARKGTVMIFVMSDGETYMASCTNPTNAMTKNPVPAYWQHSIDWAGNKSDYFAFQMTFDSENKPFYPAAEPLVKFDD